MKSELTRVIFEQLKLGRHAGLLRRAPQRLLPTEVLTTQVGDQENNPRAGSSRCRQPAATPNALLPGYPAGALQCVLLQHHLLKTFWGWSDKQLPDGTGNLLRRTPESIRPGTATQWRVRDS